MEIAADQPTDVSREANGAMLLSFTLKVNTPPAAEVRLAVGKASVPITAELKSLPAGAYSTSPSRSPASPPKT